jgi:HEAT repeat protein
MGLKITWELVREDEALTDEEREQLQSHAERWSDEWTEADPYELEYGEEEGEPLARGSSEVPDDPDHEDVQRLLLALADLRTEIGDAELVVQPKDRIRWRDDSDEYVLVKKRTPRPKSGTKKPPAARRPPVTPPLVRLPTPRYTLVGLDAWMGAVPARVPLPPGPPPGWTCALSMFGPRAVLFKGDRGHDRALDADLLRKILAELGRPTDAAEQEALLLATPIPTGAAAGQVLTRLLRDSHYHVRQKSALCLGLLGDASFAPHLVRGLDDDDNDARRGAAEGLGYLGVKDVAKELARRSWDSDSSVNAARLEAIERLDAWDEVASVIDRSSGDDAATLSNALLLAAQEGEVGELAEFLSHSDSDYQRVAARFFASRPALASQCVEPLVQRLHNSSNETGGVLAAQALGGVGEDALEPLIECLGDDGWEVRCFAGIAFASNPELAAMALDELKGKLDDSDDDVKREVALALLVSGKGEAQAEELAAGLASQRYGYLERAAEVAPSFPALNVAGMLYGFVQPGLELVPFLTDTRVDASVRAVGALLLGLAEPELTHALFERMAHDEGRNVPMELRRAAAGALMLTGYPPSFMPTVHRILLCHTGEVQARTVGRADGLEKHVGELATLSSKDGDWPVRLDALRLLQLLGPTAMAPYQSLISYTARHDPDGDVRALAQSLSEPRWRQTDPSDRLASALYSPHGASDESERIASFRGLAAEQPSLARRLARSFFRSDERALARAAAEVLGQTATEEEGAALVQLGVARLEDSNWIAREAAADLLGWIPAALIGDQLDEICEALKGKAEEDSDSDVRNAATAALGRLGRPLAGADEEEEEV